jgi:hypothetical protein
MRSVRMKASHVRFSRCVAFLDKNLHMNSEELKMMLNDTIFTG